MFEIVQHFSVTLVVVGKEDYGDDHSHFHPPPPLSVFIAANLKYKLIHFINVYI